MSPAPLRARPRFLRAAASWRDPQLWRLASGLILFAFALGHFLNHALGLVSLDAMEAMQGVRRGFWRSGPGTILLYGSLAVHVALAVLKLARRRTWRMAPWEAAQLAFGLSIPFLGIGHVAGTRGVAMEAGFDDTYTNELRMLWPGLAWSQSLLLVVVWLHAVIGLHHWLKTRAWYAAWSPALLAAAVLIPALSLAGWIEAARRLALKDLPGAPMTGAMLDAGARMIEGGMQTLWIGAGALAAGIVAWRAAEWFRRGATVTYPGGRKVRAVRGATLLETSRAAGVPHASVCGGRGRCSTCRVMVLAGAEELAPPNATEAAALSRIEAPPGVRLACQVRPEHDLAVRPLVPLRDAEPTMGREAFRWGVERRITVMFADLRGFTTLAERLYPYDSVFLLNRYFEVMSEAIEGEGGEVDKFLGDGIMALFGVAPGRGTGSRDALFAARSMLAGLDRLNAEFGGTLGDPLRMGIGIHTGPAVLGRVGGGRQAGLTALGDSVNIASRLENLNKDFGSSVIVSEAALRASGLALDGAEIRPVPVRGREAELTVAIARNLDGLREAAALPA